MAIFDKAVAYPVKFRAIVTTPINDEEYGYFLFGPVFDRADQAMDFSIKSSPAVVPLHRRGRIAALNTEGPIGSGPTSARWSSVLRYAEDTGCDDPAAKVVVCGQTEAEAADDHNRRQAGEDLPLKWYGNPTTRREYNI